MKKNNITNSIYESLGEVDPFDFYSMDGFDKEAIKKLKKIKKRHWLYIVYPESAPENWIEMLKNTMVQFAVSPLHDKDLDVAGNLKKPHWHVIVKFDGPTTFNSAVSYCEITKGPMPTICESLRGAYEYFVHKNDPDKYQYSTTDIKEFNGFVVEMSQDESMKIKQELAEIIVSESVSEMVEFDYLVRNLYDSEYYQVYSSNAWYFNSLINSFRHNPEVIEKRIKKIKAQMKQINNMKEEKKNEN